MLALRIPWLPCRYCGPTATICLLRDGTTRVQDGLHRPPPVGCACAQPSSPQLHSLDSIALPAQHCAAVLS